MRTRSGPATFRWRLPVAATLLAVGASVVLGGGAASAAAPSAGVPAAVADGFSPPLVRTEQAKKVKKKKPVRAVKRGRAVSRSGGGAGGAAAVLGGAGPPEPGSEYAVKNGIGTPNFGSEGDDSWDNYVRLFGQDQTYSCQPGATAPGTPVCVENPAAKHALESFNKRTRVLLGGGGGGGKGGFGGLGECFGFVSTSILYKNADNDPAWEAGSPADKAALDRAGGLSSLTPESIAKAPAAQRAQLQAQYKKLRDTLRERQLLQISWTYQSWWEQWAREAKGLDGAKLYALLSGYTGGGKVAGFSFYWPSPNGGSQGHAVAVLGVEGGPGSFKAKLYDPNYPRSAGSQLVVEGNRWWLENDPENLYPKQGTAVPLARPDGSPTVFALAESQMMQRRPTAWWLGDLKTSPHPFVANLGFRTRVELARKAPPSQVVVQLTVGRIVQATDDQGRTALTASGAVNGDPATNIPGVVLQVGAEAPPSLTLPRGSYRVQVAPAEGQSAVRATVWDRRGFSVINTQGGGGQPTEILVNGPATTVTATPPAGADVQVAVLRRQGAARVRAVETAVDGATGPVQAGIRDNGAAVLGGGEGARAPRARLSALGRNGYARSARVEVGATGADQRLDLKPDWGDLDSGEVTATMAGGDGAPKAMGLRSKGLVLNAITDVEISATASRVAWDVGLRRPSRVTATVVLRRDGCSCAGARQVVRGASGEILLPDTLTPGRWRAEIGIAAQAPDNPFLIQRRQDVKSFVVGGDR